jgi:hypothetical protein
MYSCVSSHTHGVCSQPIVWILAGCTSYAALTDGFIAKKHSTSSANNVVAEVLRHIGVFVFVVRRPSILGTRSPPLEGVSFVRLSWVSRKKKPLFLGRFPERARKEATRGQPTVLHAQCTTSDLRSTANLLLRATLSSQS